MTLKLADLTLLNEAHDNHKATLLVQKVFHHHGFDASKR